MYLEQRLEDAESNVGKKMTAGKFKRSKRSNLAF